MSIVPDDNDDGKESVPELPKKAVSDSARWIDYAHLVWYYVMLAQQWAHPYFTQILGGAPDYVMCTEFQRWM